MDPSGLPGLTISSGVPGSAAKPDAAIRIDRPKVCVQLRKLVQDNFDKHLYDSAVFFADKLVSMSSGNRDDVFLLATAYYRSGQYRRAVNLLKKNDLLEQKLSSLPFQFLAAQCLAKKEQWEECVTILEEALPEESERVVDIAAQIPHKHSEEVHSVAAMCQLRATAYHALDNRERAAEWYKNALKVDYFCMEAFAQLIDKQILPSSYEEELMTSLNFRPEDEWLKLLYASRLKKYGQDLEKKFAALESEEVALGGNLEVIATKAEAYYYLHDAQKAYDLTTYVRKEDPCQMACMPVHLSALVDLHLNSELFYCAHTLVESNPEAAITWFAVGCYYLLVHKYDAAQRYFHKATTMDSQLASAWIGFGNSFAAQDESDQAMAAYRTASRLFQGSHLPLLCIGTEHLRTNNLSLAEQFVSQAATLCPSDPLCYSELGVVCFRQQKYENAANYFRHALGLTQHLPQRLKEPWESTVFNLAHTYRKMKKYDLAVQCYEEALGLCPHNASTHAALGFTFHLQGRLDDAIEAYHKALGYKPEDTFSSEMLSRALQDTFSEFGNGFDGSSEGGNDIFSLGGDGGGAGAAGSPFSFEARESADDDMVL